MALALAEPLIASAVGPQIAKHLTPLAKKGLEKALNSKLASKGLHKMANALFGKKHKTARNFLKKGHKIASSKIVKKGFNLAHDLGAISDSQHEKALKLHDKLSELNQPEKLIKKVYEDMTDNRDNEDPEKNDYDKSTGTGEFKAEFHSPGWDELYRADTERKALDHLAGLLTDMYKQDIGDPNYDHLFESISDFTAENGHVKKGLSLSDLKKVADELKDVGVYLTKDGKRE